jgi:hypothetical protein
MNDVAGTLQFGVSRSNLAGAIPRSGPATMGMRQTLDVINAMEAGGVVERYAIAGAVAAYNYIEPTVTEDVDILISFDVPSDRPRSGLVTLAPILSYLKSRGYDQYRKEGLLIEGWPVQFLPLADDLDAEALAQAQDPRLRSARGTVR